MVVFGSCAVLCGFVLRSMSLSSFLQCVLQVLVSTSSLHIQACSFAPSSPLSYAHVHRESFRVNHASLKATRETGNLCSLNTYLLSSRKL
jgi:hypothetical protein